MPRRECDRSRSVAPGVKTKDEIFDDDGEAVIVVEVAEIEAFAEFGREVVDLVARTIAWHDQINRSEMPTGSPPLDHGSALVLQELAQRLGVPCMDEP